ncbi:MAG TPA: diguanylate cyclase, partial [Blastocatellia bacterium]|nr:diguanylate cyclase [Blastocatellia bacterium]
MTEPLSNQLRARPYMVLVIAAGSSVLAFSIATLPVLQLGLPFLLLAAATIGIASRISIKIPSFKSNVSISDVFIFLTILLFGAEAAVLLGAAEAFWSSRRITKKWLTTAFNASAMACSTFLAAWSLSLAFGPVTAIAQRKDYTVLIAATFLMGFVQYISNSMLIAIAGALRAGHPPLETWKKYYVWTSISYFAGALAAGLIAGLSAVIGASAFIATIPIVAIVYLTYLTYLKNVEASVQQAEQAERHLTELKESEGRFRSAFDFAPIGMALVSPDGCWLRVNRSLCEIVGYSEQELLGTSFRQITHPQDLPQFVNQIARVLDNKAVSRQMEKRYIHKQGHEVWTLASVSLIRDSESRHIIFQIQDITDRKRAEEQLVRDAFHDALTGLPNRVWFMEQLGGALDQVRQGTSNLFAVLFLDLDRFKIINDSIGHLYGDQLLIGIADRLRGCVRGDDRVARLGGDEFTILMSGLKDFGDAVRVAERIHREVAEPFRLGEYETFTTASIGIAFIDSGYDRPE